MADTVDPDQTALQDQSYLGLHSLPRCLSENLGSLQYSSGEIYEPPRDKTNKMIFAPNEDSDQPGHPPSLIRVIAVCMKTSLSA